MELVHLLKSHRGNVGLVKQDVGLRYERVDQSDRGRLKHNVPASYLQRYHTHRDFQPHPNLLRPRF
jgi:hypothetical protein